MAACRASNLPLPSAMTTNIWTLASTSPTSQLILQPFRRFTYVTAHSPTFPSLHLRHSSFSNPSVALPTCSFSNLSVTSPTSHLILQPFRCFIYVTAHSPTLLSLLRHRLFIYVTWRAAHAEGWRFFFTLRLHTGLGFGYHIIIILIRGSFQK